MMLSAVILSELSYPAMPLARQQEHPWFHAFRSSRTRNRSPHLIYISGLRPQKIGIELTHDLL